MTDLKKYDPAIEREPYTGQESVCMDEDDCGEYYKAVDVDSLISELKIQACHDANKFLMKNGLSYFPNTAQVRRASKMLAGFMDSLGGDK